MPLYYFAAFGDFVLRGFLGADFLTTTGFLAGATTSATGATTSATGATTSATGATATTGATTSATGATATTGATSTLYGAVSTTGSSFLLKKLLMNLIMVNLLYSIYR